MRVRLYLSIVVLAALGCVALPRAGTAQDAKPAAESAAASAAQAPASDAQAARSSGADQKTGKKAQRAEDEEFDPTEDVSADSAAAFPADI